jgi:hypothetical protein
VRQDHTHFVIFFAACSQHDYRDGFGQFATLDPRNPGQVEEAKRLSDLLEPGNDKLVLVDVTPVNRTRNFHNFSLETPEFFDDLFLRLTGTDLPNSRELYSLRTPTGARYFVLTRRR